MEINRLEYKFKICTTIDEYARAMEYFEKVADHIVELTHNDIEIILRLKKGLLRQYKRYINNLKQPDVINSAKGPLKVVYDSFSDNLYREGIYIIDKFISCINTLFYKVKDEKIFALMYSIRAGIFSFMNIYSKEKSKYLELALANHKKAVDIAMLYLDKIEIIKYKIFYSFCKFSYHQVNDKFRSILCCFNILEEINQVKLNFDNLEDYPQQELCRLEKKFKKFYESNLEEYNKIIGLYHPEYKN